MSDDEPTSRLLTELELSEYETRAYLSLIEGGVLVAREISDRASIPYAKVYQILNDLIEKQLITGDEGRPKKFRARPPKEAIYDRLQTMEKIWRESHQRRKKLLNSIIPDLVSLYESSEVTPAEEQGVWNISGSSNIASRLIKLANLSKDKIVVITGNYDSFEDNFLKSLEDHSSVPLVLITNNKVDSAVFSTIYKHKTLGDATIIIFDNTAMMSIAKIQHGKYSSGEYTGVLTQISALVTSALTNYEVMMQ